MEKRVVHFKLGDDIWHSWYDVEPIRDGFLLWQKVFGSDEECNCPNPQESYDEDARKRSLIK